MLNVEGALILLVRGPHHDQAAVGTRHGAADEHQIIVGVDAHHAQIAGSYPAGAVTSRHALALLGPAAAAVAGMRADASRRPVMPFDAVAGFQAFESMAF